MLSHLARQLVELGVGYGLRPLQLGVNGAGRSGTGDDHADKRKATGNQRGNNCLAHLFATPDLLIQAFAPPYRMPTQLPCSSPDSS